MAAAIVCGVIFFPVFGPEREARRIVYCQEILLTFWDFGSLTRRKGVGGQVPVQ